MARANRTDVQVLVALDASRFGFEALEAAASLAAELRTELQAIFVEDTNLLRLAGLPFAREISYSSAASRQLDLSGMERALRADADRIRRAIATTCHQVRIEWSFNVTRGHLTRTPLQAAAKSDVLIMGRVGSSLSTIASTGTRTTERPIGVVVDGSRSDHHALETGALLARFGSQGMVALLAAPTAPERVELQRRCLEWFKSHGVAESYPPQAVSDMASLLRSTRQCDARLLVINRNSPLLDEGAIETLVNQLDCPVGLVR